MNATTNGAAVSDYPDDQTLAVPLREKRAFPDYNLEVEELRDLGDVTLGHMCGWGHGADSATPLLDPFWIPMRWRDGKVVWWRNCSTEAEALEAVGLAE